MADRFFNDTNQFWYLIDPAHRSIELIPPGSLSWDIWNDKYYWNDEKDPGDTFRRVVSGVYMQDPDPIARIEAEDAMRAGLWMPAGRIIAGAGTTKVVTLMNCYVTGTIEDSMVGIMREHTNFALTMQQGGGDGANFSTIRPENAILRRTGTKASGPLPFMHMWNSMCTTIRSSGDRRGAMMGVMCDTHPDLLKFIEAKHTAGVLNNFNLSILVSDALMEAVREDADWVLYFDVPQYNHPTVVGTQKLVDEYDETLLAWDFTDENGVQQYAYKVMKARELWEIITQSTYMYSEPGVIFIDRINELNNLNYCEVIAATNPCGEQPLPPHGACDLGHAYLPRMVQRPFQADASFDFGLLRRIIRIAVRFLDNVIDVTHYPLEEQRQEMLNKRRIGVGFTGLADVFAMLGIRYGSFRSVALAEEIQKVICEEAYLTSIELAEQRGAFPAFDAEKYLSDESTSFVNTRLPEDIKLGISKHGIRNGVVLTVAPTGTTSTMYGNPGAGLEPFFALYLGRKVRQADDSFKEYREYVYSARLYRERYGEGAEIPSSFVTIKDLTVAEHIAIQGAVQRWVDASISKTINIPTEMSYEAFVQVYDLAYAAGCKGCTTYRPSEVRGSILSDASTTPKAVEATTPVTIPLKPTLRQRPEVLSGKTYKIKWPRRRSAIYCTINSDESGQPFEMFITSKDGTHLEWTTALTVMITAFFRQGLDFSFIPEELQQIQSMHDGAWLDRQYFGSLPAYLGFLIEKHIAGQANTLPTDPAFQEVSPATTDVVMEDLFAGRITGEVCPECGAPAVVNIEGCDKCANCGHSHCG